MYIFLEVTALKNIRISKMYFFKIYCKEYIHIFGDKFQNCFPNQSE